MNKTIYILWFQGFNQAPNIVEKCVTSWKYYNPHWNVLLLDNTNLCNYIKLQDYVDITTKNINYTALSDIVRIALLNTYGGLWVDATTFCNKPLDEWLIKCIDQNQGFFAFNKPGPDRLLSSWFIYSEKEHYMTDAWLKAIKTYFIVNDKPQTYYWMHYIFGNLYDTDEIFMKMWNKVPVLSANGNGPHYLQEKGLFNTVTNTVKKNIDDKITPLYKLTYKCTFPSYDETLNMYYLYSTIKP